MKTKWIGDVYINKVAGWTIPNGKWKSIFIPIEPPFEIVDGDIVQVKSEFLGWNDEGKEVWSNVQ